MNKKHISMLKKEGKGREEMDFLDMVTAGLLPVTGCSLYALSQRINYRPIKF